MSKLIKHCKVFCCCITQMNLFPDLKKTSFLLSDFLWISLDLVNVPFVNTQFYPREFNSKFFLGVSVHLMTTMGSGAHVCTTWFHPFGLSWLGEGKDTWPKLGQSEPQSRESGIESEWMKIWWLWGSHCLLHVERKENHLQREWRRQGATRRPEKSHSLRGKASELLSGSLRLSSHF